MIVRSNTGKYHTAPAANGRPWCNVNMRAKPATEKEVRAAAANHSMFCDKCFNHAAIEASINHHFAKEV